MLKNILSQNGKMKKSSQNGTHLYNFGIPAFLSSTGLKTCPNAGVCATGCYARSGTYNFSNVASVYEARLKLTLSPNFSKIMLNEIESKHLKLDDNETLLIRIHDSGDFYNAEYVSKWFDIMLKLQVYNNIKFYAYTKMVHMFKNETPSVPNNFRLIYSLGGLQDKLIDLELDRHSKVFSTLLELSQLGYTDATQDDTVAALGTSNKIGLVYHGTKKYTNTKWSKTK